MKVYLLYESYYDYCNNWETLVDVFAQKNDAERAMKILERKHKKDKLTSHFIREVEVK